MIKCLSGLFIGIDCYGALDPSKNLFCACSDATRLEHYFSAGYPKGVWRSLTNAETRTVGRLDILEAIRRWIRSVRKFEGGILFFAGHGQVTSGGLVLAGEDYIENMAYDSGVPLDRVIGLIGEFGNPESRYVLMLDCCRKHKEEFVLENVTSNISILYASLPGEPAVETLEGGVFTTTLVNWLNSVEATEIEGYPFCCLDGVCSGLQRGMEERLGGIVQVPDHFGRDLKDIYLPKLRVRPKFTVYDKGDAPRVCLRTKELGNEILQASYIMVREQGLRYCAGSLGNLNDALDLSYEIDGNRLEVVLDFIEDRYDISAFVDFMVYKTGNLFCELELCWNYRLSNDMFAELANSRHLLWTRSNDGRTEVFWETASRAQGRITFDSWSRFGTRAVVHCRPAGGIKQLYPILHLMPLLSTICKDLVTFERDETGELDPFYPIADDSVNDVRAQLSAEFIEYCRFAEAALAAGFIPDTLRFRGGSSVDGGAKYGEAILKEFWKLLCTEDPRYEDVREKCRRSRGAAISAVCVYGIAKSGLDAGMVAAAVSAIFMVVTRVGINALCEVLSS